MGGNAMVNGIGSNGHRSRFTAASCRNINLGYVAAVRRDDDETVRVRDSVAVHFMRAQCWHVDSRFGVALSVNSDSLLEWSLSGHSGQRSALA